MLLVQLRLLNIGRRLSQLARRQHRKHVALKMQLSEVSFAEAEVTAQNVDSRPMKAARLITSRIKYSGLTRPYSLREVWHPVVEHRTLILRVQLQKFKERDE